MAVMAFMLPLLKSKSGDFLDKKDIRSMTKEELIEDFAKIGEPKFRAEQVFSWLCLGTESFSQMTNISINLRNKLDEIYFIPTVKIIRKLVSQVDNTKKYLYELYDGNLIESVLMEYKHGYTVCISTQVGCRMGCSFCASGLNGLVRNLLPSEMLAQVMMAGKDNNIRVSNIVLMGMGEPLDNFDNVLRFLELVNNKDSLNIGYRHISLSTSGVVPKIIELSKYKLPITLSISLHAPFDDIRTNMMKVNKAWNIGELINACKLYQKATGRRISFEYAMIDGVNDTRACAEKLAEILKGIMCHVNLIPVNPVKENDYKKSTKATLNAFANKLISLGINATIRRTLGSDIDASCGQLRQNFESNRGDTI